MAYLFGNRRGRRDQMVIVDESYEDERVFVPYSQSNEPLIDREELAKVGPIYDCFINCLFKLNFETKLRCR